MNRKVTILILLVCLLVARPAEADGTIDKRLRLTVNPQFAAFRGQAPLATTITLSWSDSRLMEGRLRLKWYVRQTLLGTYVSPEISLADSSITRSVLLPPVIMPNDDAVFSVQGEFVTDRRVYDLDIHDLAVPLDWRRTLMVGICRTSPLRMDTTDTSVDRDRRLRLVQSLRLEHFIDEPFQARELSTLVVDVDPAEMPNNPLRMLAFDLMVIPGESLGKLSADGWECLTTWVEAGGSLCCLVDGPVPAESVEFLNRLAGGRPEEAPYLHLEGGRLLPVSGDAVGIDLYRPGLGRLAVARGRVDYDSQDWQRTLLFLWKVRQDRVRDWEQGREWPLERSVDGEFLPPEMGNPYLVRFSLEPDRPWSVAPLTSLLLPQSIKGLPLLTVSAILLLFLLVIAPGDYYLLGWLRRRRWTWVLFPAMSLLFTWLTMGLAERHLGSANLGRSITFVDLSSDGRPLRSTRIGLSYSASNRTDAAEQQTSLMVPIDPETRETSASRNRTPKSPQYEEPWTYVGNLPGRHVVQRHVRQWSPRVSRTTTLGLPEELAHHPRIDFDALRAQYPSATFLELEAIYFEELKGQPAIMESIVGTASKKKWISFIAQLSSGNGLRLFSLVSQVSPNAAGHWDDLAVLDPSDDNQQLRLAIIEETEGQYVVYRQLVTEEN